MMVCMYIMYKIKCGNSKLSYREQEPVQAEEQEVKRRSKVKKDWEWSGGENLGGRRMEAEKLQL